MKARECICGRGDECNGVSAAFYILDDPRSGYMQIPPYRESSSEDTVDIETNQLRHVLLSQLVPFHELDSVHRNQENDPLYVANHHFHPKLVSACSTGMKCTFPIALTEEEMFQLKNLKQSDLKLLKQEPVMDPKTKKATGEYYVVPNYSFQKVTKQLKKEAKRKKPRLKKHHKKRKNEEEEDNELIGMVISVVEKPSWQSPITKGETLDAATDPLTVPLVKPCPPFPTPMAETTDAAARTKEMKRKNKKSKRRDRVQDSEADNIYTIPASAAAQHMKFNTRNTGDDHAVIDDHRQKPLQHNDDPQGVPRKPKRKGSAHRRKKTKTKTRMRYHEVDDEEEAKRPQDSNVQDSNVVDEDEIASWVPKSVQVVLPSSDSGISLFKSCLMGSKMSHGTSSDSDQNMDSDDDTLGMEAKLKKQTKRWNKEIKQLSTAASACSSSKSNKVRRAVTRLQEQLKQMEEHQEMYLSGQDAQKQELLQLIEGVGRKPKSKPAAGASIMTGRSATSASTISQTIRRRRQKRIDSQPRDEESKTSYPTMGENLMRLQEQLEDMEMEQEQYLSSREAQKRELLTLIEDVEEESENDNEDAEVSDGYGEDRESSRNVELPSKQHIGDTTPQDSAPIRKFSVPSMSQKGSGRETTGSSQPNTEPTDLCGRRGNIQHQGGDILTRSNAKSQTLKSILRNKGRPARTSIETNGRDGNNPQLYGLSPMKELGKQEMETGINHRELNKKDHLIGKPALKRPSTDDPLSESPFPSRHFKDKRLAVPPISSLRLSEREKQSSSLRPPATEMTKRQKVSSSFTTTVAARGDSLVRASEKSKNKQSKKPASQTNDVQPEQQQSVPRETLFPYSNLRSSKPGRRGLSISERSRGSASRRFLLETFGGKELKKRNGKRSLDTDIVSPPGQDTKEEKKESEADTSHKVFEPSVITVQSFGRSIVASSRLRRQRQSLIQIQSVVRGVLVRKHVRIRRASALAIQSNFRGYQARRLASRKQDAMHLIAAQSYARRFIALNTTRRRKRASLVIQTAMRSLMKKQNGAVAIQSFYRYHRNKRDFKRILVGVVALQAMTRGFIERSASARREWAACTIQSGVRKRLFLQGIPGRAVGEHHDEEASTPATDLAEIVKLQSIVRSFLLSLSYQRQRYASIAIQSATRGMLTRLECKEKFKRVVLIQSVCRRFLTLRDYQAATRSIPRVQALVRGSKDRRLYTIQRASAITIQSYSRAYLDLSFFIRRRNAAIVIQSATRGMLGRGKVSSSHGSAVTIQAAVRQYLSATRYQTLLKGVVLLQASSRGVAERKSANELIARLMLQAAARTFLVREAYLQQRRASILIQSAARGMIQRKETNELRSCLILQSIVRSFTSSRSFQRQRISAVLIQSVMRGALERKQIKLRHTSSSIPWSKRSGRSMTELESHSLESVVVVQSVMRAALCSSAYHKKKDSCVTMQGTVRGFLTRRKLENLRSRANLRFQVVARGVTLLQAFSRGKVARQTMASMRDKAILLQSVVRAFIGFSSFRRMRSSSISIQSAARGMQARKQHAVMRSSATRVQSFVRRYLREREYESTTKRIVLLQATARGVSQRKLSSERMVSVILLQSRARTFVAAKRLIRQRSAAICIQRRARGVKERNHQSNLHRCARIVQAATRLYIQARSDRDRCEMRYRKMPKDPENSQEKQSPLSYSRTEMHAHLLALESKRRSTYERKLASCLSRWKSSLQLLRAGVHETERAERLILGSAIVNQACADAMNSIYNDVLLDDDLNAVADEKRQMQLIEERGNFLTEDKERVSEEIRLIGSLVESHVVLAEQFAESATFVVNEVTEEFSRFRELTEAKVDDVKQMGDATIKELKEAEMRVLEAWDSYDAVAAEQLAPGKNHLNSPPTSGKRRHSSKKKSSEPCADLWLVEMRYRFAVAHQSSIWEKASDLFQIIIKTEFARRERLKEVLIEFVPRQRRLFSITASTQAQVLQELMDRDDTYEQIEVGVKAYVQSLVASSPKIGSFAEKGYDFGGNGLISDSAVISDFPLANRLVQAAVIVELTTFRGCWQKMLAVVTSDCYLHLFVMPSNVDPAFSTSEVLLELPIPDSNENHISGILIDFDPADTIFLPNCVATPNEQGYIFLTESRVGRYGNPTARKLLLRTDRQEDTQRLLRAIQRDSHASQTASETTGELSDGDSYHSALGRMMGETNIPSNDAFQFAHGA